MREPRKPKSIVKELSETFAKIDEEEKPERDRIAAEKAEELPKRADRLRELHITIQTEGGNCPVQIEGFVKGKPFYFRARGSSWSLGIGGEPVGDPEFEICETYCDGEQFEAGWMPIHEAFDFLIHGVEKWNETRNN